MLYLKTGKKDGNQHPVFTTIIYMILRKDTKLVCKVSGSKFKVSGLLMPE
jgi:hypothetical protein